MSGGAALIGALLTTLATPATWPLALAVFLLRGGLFLVVLPIVVLPSPVGLGNLLAPALIAVVLQGPSLELVIVVGLVVVAVLVWFVVGGLAAAALEAESARLVAARQEDTHPATARATAGIGNGQDRQARVATRILAARIVAHAPTALVLLLGSIRLVDAAYRELTAPFDVVTPIVLRVLRDAPEAVVAIVVCWAAGEIVGGLAARRIALDGAPVGSALRGAIRAVAHRPLEVLGDFLIPLATLCIVLLPSTVAATAAWGLVRAALRSRGDPISATLAVLVFVTLWLVGLGLVAVTVAWRSAVWSVAHREVQASGRRQGEDSMGNETA